MMNADTPQQADDQAVERIVAAGPVGAIALAGTSTTIVILIWLVFYLLVFLPRAGAP